MRIVLAGIFVLLGAYVPPASSQNGRSWSILEQPHKETGVPAKGPRTRSPSTQLGPIQTTPRSDPVASDSDSNDLSKPWQWRIVHTTWNERDEKGYEKFVQGIGESGCRTVHACLTSPLSNPLYQASNPPGFNFYADCADLPYMLRAYYAWKNGLPFSYSTAVAPLGPSTDMRYTARGNQIVSRKDLVDPNIDARRAIPQILATISSAQYRYPPNYAGKLLPDHYPVRISRDAIKPGTIIYDPNGHLAVVYKVSLEGRIRYIDTHPDNSLTRGVYGKSFTRASPAMGAGFKRWRPQTLVGAIRQTDGSYQGGHIVLAPDENISDWSDEQFFGNEPVRPEHWSMGRFILDGEVLDYYDYVRSRLANAGFRYDPIDETRVMVHTLCEDIKYRIDAVDIGLKAGIHQRPQPSRLPNNIYGTEGDWETYSTPSRDARLKTSFRELRDEVARFLALAAEGGQKLAYSGSDLRRDLSEAYRKETSACRITYARSDGSQKELSFQDIKQRLFLLSFDPYHCVERRWGAYDADELSTCPDGAEKKAWYEAEQRLRNQTDRTYEARMGFSLIDLQRAVPGSGIDAPPNIEMSGLLSDDDL